MENAQLVSLSRLTALNRQMAIVANNVANMNTTGFKAEGLLFEEYLETDASAESFEFSDRDVHFVLDDRSTTDFAEGGLQTTGNQTDVAIKGEGFFTIQTAQGDRYTRNGAFTIDPNGQLVTHDGSAVLSDGGTIQFSPEDTDITITGDGTVSGNVSGEVGRLQIVRFDNPQALNRIGDNLFDGDDAIRIETPRVSQFAIESSNVDPVLGITQMIEVQRAYQELANLMGQQNELREEAIQTLGRVRVNV
ncbi:MAG: flagellar basal-body rod protein FlgF [Pseudomonadota bacterium]